jgi:UbiD family decarboxylase
MPKGSSTRAQVDEFIARWANFPVKAEWRGDPPWAQNSRGGDDVNIFEVLPLFRLNDGDGGFYLDKAAVISRDPDDPEDIGKQNVGIYRIQVKGTRKLALQPVPMHDIAQHLRKAEEKGEDLPIAITLGNEPVISIVASTPLEYDQNEYELAGALRGAPAPIARAPLTGLPVPWGSEVVIEGAIEGRKREIEGPFGEFTGHYSGGRNMTVIRVGKISYRTGTIFEHLYLGMPWTEIDYLLGANTCVPIYEQLRTDFPEVQAVNAMYTHGLGVIVLHQEAVRRLRPRRRAAGADHSARPRLRQDRHHRRRGRRPLQPASGDVGSHLQGQPRRRCDHHPELVSPGTRPRLPAARHHQQADH